MRPLQKRKWILEKDEVRTLKGVGRNIANGASKRRISIERLAYEAGISKGYLYDCVRGTGNPTVVILSRIASALDIPVWSLLKL